MIAIVILCILAISVVTTLAYSSISIMDRSQSMIRLQNDKQIMDAAEAMITNKLKPIGNNQRLVAELGIEGERHQEIPNNWGIKTKNSTGMKLIYCPIGDEINGPLNNLKNGNIKLSNDDEYAVRYTTNERGIKFVVQSSFIKDQSYENIDVIALLISPSAGDSINCNDVYYDESNEGPSRFKIKDGRGSGNVRAISKDSVMTYQANQPITISVSENASASLNDLSNNWESIQPFKFSINLDNNNGIRMNGNKIRFQNDSPGISKEIIVSGDNIANDIVSAEEFTIIEFKNVSARVSNLTLTDKIKVIAINSRITINDAVISGELIAENSEVKIVNTRINNGLKASNSKIEVSGTSFISKNSTSNDFESLSAIEIYSSKAYISGTLNVSIGETITNAINAGSSSLDANNSNISINTNHHNSKSVFSYGHTEINIYGSTVNLNSNGKNNESLFKLDDRSSASIINSNLYINGGAETAIESRGSISIENSNISNSTPIANAILLKGFGSLTLNNASVLGGQSTILNGVVADNTNLISGDNAHIYANDCWKGESFKYSGDQSLGSSYKMNQSNNNDAFSSINRSNWQCN